MTPAPSLPWNVKSYSSHHRAWPLTFQTPGRLHLHSCDVSFMDVCWRCAENNFWWALGGGRGGGGVALSARREQRRGWREEVACFHGDRIRRASQCVAEGLERHDRIVLFRAELQIKRLSSNVWLSPSQFGSESWVNYEELIYSWDTGPKRTRMSVFLCVRESVCEPL